MHKCWATALGDCGSEKSREHYVSANILGKGPLNVRGMKWCRGEYKKISPATFRRRMLCKHHNERLSPLDQAGGLAWRHLTNFAISAKAAHVMPKTARPVSLRIEAIDGLLFERWLLKTVTNLTYDGIGLGNRPWAPPSEWVEIIFGLRPFPARCGFYLETAPLSTQLEKDNYFAARILTDPKTDLPCGGQLKINDWGVIVSLTPLREKEVQYRPRFLKLRHRGRLFRVLRFDWPRRSTLPCNISS